MDIFFPPLSLILWVLIVGMLKDLYLCNGKVLLPSILQANQVPGILVDSVIWYLGNSEEWTASLLEYDKASTYICKFSFPLRASHWDKTWICGFINPLSELGFFLILPHCGNPVKINNWNIICDSLQFPVYCETSDKVWRFLSCPRWFI